jgi:hypothetical protein
VTVHATNRANAISRSSNVRTRTAAVYRAGGCFPAHADAPGGGISGGRPTVKSTRRKYRVGRDLRVIVRIQAQADDPHVTAPGINAKEPQDSKA